MIKALIFIVPAILFSTYVVCERLECYHCHSDSGSRSLSDDFVPCNERNLTASNTWVCPSEKSKCIYETIEVESTKQRQIWRTCSDERYEPCSPKAVPPGMKMLQCVYCDTNRCNLFAKENEKENNTFTININANINLFIRQ